MWWEPQFSTSLVKYKYMTDLVKYPYPDLGHLLNEKLVLQGQLGPQRRNQAAAGGFALIQHDFEALSAAEIRIDDFP